MRSIHRVRRDFRKCSMLLVTSAFFMALLGGCVNTLKQQDAKVDPRQALQTHVQLAANYLSNENRDLTRYHINKALDIDKNSAAAHNVLALLYQIEGEPELAEEHFVKATKNREKFPPAFNNYGNFLFEHERFEEAYAEFDKASKDLNYSRRDRALYNLGRAALKLGRTEKAEASFTHALNLNPRMALAMLELSEIRFNERDYAEAKRYLDMFTDSSRQTAASLWLGIRVEQIFGNKNNEASYALQLKNLHPYSQEYLEYKNSLK